MLAQTRAAAKSPLGPSVRETIRVVAGGHARPRAYRTGQIPRFVAKMTMGESDDSSARFRYVKHSMSSMWTSSMKSTPGTSSATPVSMYLLTTLLISLRSLSVISVLRGFMSWFIIDMMSWPPCVRPCPWSGGPHGKQGVNNNISKKKLLPSVGGPCAAIAMAPHLRPRVGHIQVVQRHVLNDLLLLVDVALGQRHVLVRFEVVLGRVRVAPAHALGARAGPSERALGAQGQDGAGGRGRDGPWRRTLTAPELASM